MSAYKRLIRVCFMFVLSFMSLLFMDMEASAYTEWNYGSTGSAQKFVVPYNGDYRIEVWGSQGGGNGGTGGYVRGDITLLKGSELNMYVGNTSGYNGGGSGSSYGGGATDVRLNGISLDDRLMSAAGGGGGSGGSIGGSDTGAGGASVGSGPGIAGVNGGGGGRAYNYSYTTSGYWVNSGYYEDVYQNVIVGTYPGFCNDAGPGVCYEYEYKKVGTRWVDTSYYVSGTTYTTQGNPGKGGSNFVSSGLVNVLSQNGGNVSNGRVKVTYLADPIGITFDSVGTAYRKSIDVRFTLSKGTNDISHYILPDGTRVDGLTEGTFTVTSNGTYEVTAVDSEGLESRKSILIDRIDLEAPTGTLSSLSGAWTNNKVTLRLSGLSDVKSGLGTLVLPDSTEVDITGRSSFDYDVYESGTYVFVIKDKLGNSLTRSIVVTNIDKVLPSVTITPRNLSWVNGSVTADIVMSDVSGIVSREYAFVMKGSVPTVYTSFTGTTLTSPSTTGDRELYVRVRDGAGNIGVYSSEGFRTDRDLPSISLSLSPNSWTNGDVSLNVLATDVHSGVASVNVTGPSGYVRNLGSVTEGSAVVSVNGTYTVTVVDRVGNSRSSSIVVDKIDRTVPNSPTITLDSLNWSKVGLGFRLTDNGDAGVSTYRSGIARMEYSFDQVTWFTYALGAKIPDDKKGLVTLYARSVDVAGNVSNVVSAVAKIDDTAPVFDVAEVRVIGGKPNVFVNAVDIHSGLALSPYRFEKRIEGLTSFTSVRNWGLVPNIEIVEDVPNALYVFRAFAMDLNNNEGVSREIGYVSAPKLSALVDDKKSNNVKFTLDRSLGIDDGVEVEVYRSGKLIGKLASGNVFEDRNLAYERTYNYEFVTVADFGGSVLRSLPVKLSIETGVPEAYLELIGDGVRRTVFSDTVKIQGSMEFQNGGLFNVSVMDSSRNILSETAVKVDPFVKTLLDMDVDLSGVTGNRLSISFSKDGFESLAVEREIDVTDALIKYEKLSEGVLDNIYK